MSTECRVEDLFLQGGVLKLHLIWLQTRRKVIPGLESRRHPTSNATAHQLCGLLGLASQALATPSPGRAFGQGKFLAQALEESN